MYVYTYIHTHQKLIKIEAAAKIAIAEIKAQMHSASMAQMHSASAFGV